MAPRLLALAAFALGSTLLACAAPCEKVADRHTAFRRATAPAAVRGGSDRASDDGQAHIGLSIPYEVIDAMVAKELDRVPSLKLPLPAVAGVSLGSLGLAVSSVRARAAKPGELGFRITIDLRQGKRAVTSVIVDARVKPRLRPREGSLSVALSGEDVVALTPSLPKNSRKQLGDWIWSQLPGAAKMLVNKATVTTLAGDLAEQLMRQASRKVERELLDDLGEIARFELDLPEELPIARIALAAGERYLDIDLRTSLQVEHGLAPGHPRVEGLHQNSIQVRLSGDAAAALANHAIREGRIPSRWTLEGEPDPEGPIHAGVGWADGARDALELHLFALEGDCAHVVLRGEPHLKVGRSQLEIGTERARVEQVVGSAKVKAGLFFSRSARRGVELIETTAASAEVQIGRSAMRARISSATVVGDEIVLGLRLQADQGGGR